VPICDANGIEISGEDELSSLFVQAALYDESGSPQPLAPTYLLSGCLPASLDLLNYPDVPPIESPWSEQKGSYAMFPDLEIN
jgi:hypothetical protein